MTAHARRDIHGPGPTPATYPLVLACLLCDPNAVFYSLRHLVEHLMQTHPRSMQNRTVGQ